MTTTRHCPDGCLVLLPDGNHRSRQWIGGVRRDQGVRCLHLGRPARDSRALPAAARS